VEPGVAGHPGDAGHGGIDRCIERRSRWGCPILGTSLCSCPIPRTGHSLGHLLINMLQNLPPSGRQLQHYWLAIRWMVVTSAAIGVEVLSCNQNSASPRSKAHIGVLEAEQVARVGDSVIDQSMVSRVVVDSKVSTALALEQLIDHRLIALEARQGLLQSGRFHAIERGILARALLERIAAQTRALGLPTEAEIEQEVEKRWTKFDRPDAVSVTHFVVQVRDPKEDSNARLRAEELARRVAGITDPKMFEERVKEAAAGDSSVVVESLPPTTTDGRAFLTDDQGEPTSDGPRLDPQFAKAANQLGLPGDQSKLIHTSFGYHVILLEGRVRGHLATIEEKRAALSEEVYVQRARNRITELIRADREKTGVFLERSSAELTATVGVAP
jgi:hypothetical protein